SRSIIYFVPTASLSPPLQNLTPALRYPDNAKQKAIDAVADLAEQVKAKTAEADRLGEEFRLAWLEVPNLVAEDAADGFTEDDSVEIRRHGEGAPSGTDHATLGATLDIIDTERAAKVSGSRFGYIKGKGALL